MYRYVFFSGCHRFDQSTLAVLLANAYNIINHCLQLCVLFFLQDVIDSTNLHILLANVYSIINHCVQLCVFFAGCHRFDQSTLGLLLANTYSYNYTVYRDFMATSPTNGKFVRISRESYKNLPLKHCAS